MSARPTIAIDFDGTLVAHEYPVIGHEVPGAVASVLEIQRYANVILWTMRSKVTLVDALVWCEQRGIQLWGVNQNPDQVRTGWSTSHKQYAHAYIDDAAIGCPLIEAPETRLTRERGRPMVDWARVMPMLRERFGWPVPDASEEPGRGEPGGVVL